jgi:accessory gene regulator protein AgrB
VNLFRQKLAIFIILSPVMLIAALVGYTLGIWWTFAVVFFPFMFFRFAPPGAGRSGESP